MKVRDRIIWLVLVSLGSACLWGFEQVLAAEKHTYENDVSEDAQDENTAIPLDGSQHSIEKKYLALEEGFKSVVNSLLKRALPHVLEASNNAELSAGCMGSFLKIIAKMRNLDREVFRMIDASAKLAPGLIEGSLTEFGNYYECLKVSVLDDFGEKEFFRGSYCMVKSRPPLPEPKPRIVPIDFTPVNMSIFSENSALRDLLTGSGTFYYTQARMGVCMPSTCSVEDVNGMIKPLFEGIHWEAEVEYCRQREDRNDLNAEEWICVLFLATLMLPVIVATTVHACLWIMSYTSDKPLKTTHRLLKRLLTLSAYETARKVLVVDPPRDDVSRDLQVFHGLRAATVVWIIWVHHFAYNDVAVYSYARISREIVGYYRNQIFNNGWLAVDTFFYVSGFFLAYAMKRMSGRIGILKITLFYLLRWWRLIPMACVAIATLFLIAKVGDGPIWQEFIGKELQKCRDHWLLLMLNFQNVLHHDELCMVPFWYISVDTQLYLIFVGLVLYTFRSEGTYRRGFVAMAAISLVGIIILVVQNFVNEYHPTALYVAGDLTFTTAMLSMTYMQPWVHFGPFTVGVFSCWLYLKHRDIAISKTVEILGWAFATSLMLTVLFVTKNWGAGELPSQWISALYASTHRSLWAGGLAWVVFACTTGRGGIVNSILGYQALVPISRLSYAMYVMHVPLIWHRMWTIDERTHITFMPQFYNGMGSFVLTFAAALLATVFCERTILFLKEVVMGESNETKRGLKTTKQDETIVNDERCYMEKNLNKNLHLSGIAKESKDASEPALF
ncbi:nose resistant to fluoxetine protein 6-like isoform X2 [Varroa destructor]|uniref:Nose resistant-to-fluoxetine protein N-terminal domain-containing protein n=1 Tax=Varroa destructor TaxID=109461 RepID=A0A7M7JZL5_VARDE|nr:nose resistant to fluoxetine protein 6-like isoform X2 [Varroa destructor]